MGDVAVAELRNDLFADGAGAENKSSALTQSAEDALGQFHSRRSGGHWPGAKFGFVAHPLTDFEGALKHPVQNGTGRARFVRKAVRFADLAQDFGFAEHHRIKAGGYAKQMADGV